MGRLAHCGLGFAHGAVPARILPTVLQDWVALYVFLSHCGAVILLLRACYCLLRPHILLHMTPTVGLVLLMAQYLLEYCKQSSRAGSHSTLSFLFVVQVPVQLS